MSGRKRITLVAGARPNFMKIAPIVHAIIKDGSMDYRLVHTGQHYDKVMSDTFFEELNIPKPDVNLGCGGGSQAEQTAKIMEAFEQDLMENKTDLVVVVGDVTSTMACTIAAKKIHVDVAHVEAGIRSYDMTMPEEVNRMVTDSLADYFFTTTEDAKLLLENRNVNPSVVYFVGNVMIDTLMANYDRLRKPDFYDRMNLKQGEYLVLTMHRPNNVDNIAHFDLMLREICENANGLPIVFPIHPRTAKMMTANGLSFSNLHLVEPLGYLEFNYLVRNSKAVVTDSGGVTEETTVMGIPCMTLRDNTDRPETCSVGTNELIGTDPQNIAPAMKRLMSGEWKKGPSSVRTAGGHSPRRYATFAEVSGDSRYADATSILSDTWCAALFQDGTIFIKGALPGRNIFNRGRSVALRLPKLPENFSYTGFAVTGDYLYASWEETDFYCTARSGFLSVNLGKILY